MDKQTRQPANPKEAGEYRAPELVVHGTVDEVTRGTAQGLPDVGAPGSTFPDGNAP